MRRVVDVSALLFCAALACLYLTHQVLDGDEAIFASGAMRMAAFDLPVYEAGWDHKPPGIFVVYRLVMMPFSRESLLGPHVAVALTWLGSALLLGLAARRLLGPRGFAPAVALYAVLRSFGAAKAGAANTEAFLQLPLIAGGWLLLVDTDRPRRNALLGGALLAVAALFKPPVAEYGLAAVLAVALVRGWRSAWTTAWGGFVGAVAVLGAAAGVMALQGDLEGFWTTNVVANQIYLEHSPPVGLGDVADGLWREISRRKAVWLLGLAGLGFAAFAPARVGLERRGRQLAGACACLIVIGLHQVTLGGHFFRHYWLMVYPALALAGAAGWLGSIGAWKTRRTTWIVRGVAVAALAFLWVPAQRQDKRWLRDALRNDSYRKPNLQLAVDEVVKLSGPDDPIFVWGINPEFYLFSGRVPATRFITCSFLTGSLRYDVRYGEREPDPDYLPGSWDRFFSDLREHPPRVIVDTSPSGKFSWNLFPFSKFPRLDAYVSEHYHRHGNHGGYDLYVRKAP